MATQYTFFPHNNNVIYKKFDVIRGLTNSDSYYLYATQDNAGQKPNSSYIYPITSWSREDFKIRVNFGQTGSGPNFAAGSLVRITGSQFGEANYTGMVLEGGLNYIDFVSNGLPSGGAVGGAVNTVYNPAWTSGFMFEPSYSSTLDTQTRKIEAKFGDGYSQRQRDGLNSNNHNWKLAFENRSDRETKAIANFIEDKGGVDAFELLIGANRLVPDPKLKYIAVSPQTSPQSFNINNVTADFVRVFDL